MRGRSGLGCSAKDLTASRNASPELQTVRGVGRSAGYWQPRVPTTGRPHAEYSSTFSGLTSRISSLLRVQENGTMPTRACCR